MRSQYNAAEKAVDCPAQKLVKKQTASCGSRQILAKVIYVGVYTTDKQILRGEHRLEPKFLGHEGVYQVLKVGNEVQGIAKDSMIVINPNISLDKHDKFCHTSECLCQEYYLLEQEVLDRRQALLLDGPLVHISDFPLEPLGYIIAAHRRMSDRLKESVVLIVGAGVIRIAFVTKCVKYGARRVMSTNLPVEKIKYAIKAGVVESNNTLTISKHTASQVDLVSAGKGADIVVICVS